MLKPIAAAATLLIAAVMPAAAGYQDTSIDAVLAERSDAAKARDIYRHPKETLTFFEVGEGMTIIDTLPGAWYGKIIAPLIGPEGTYIGARYSREHSLAVFGEGRFSDPASFTRFQETFPTDVESWALEAPSANTFFIFEAPEELYGTVDRYFFFRSIHHLNRRAPEYLDKAAEEAFKLVKPGGIVGVVAHRAPEGHSDAWASGDNGYVKQSRAIDAFTKAGFVLEATSEINANPKDKPKDAADGARGDFVWRLPPSGDATDIGESDRMTLKFRRP